MHSTAKFMHVLAVEDDAVASSVLEALVTSLGHQLTMAENGLQALSILESRPIHVVISDWEMPHLDGLQLCSHTRQRTRPYYTYFILLTKAAASAENMELALAAGVDDFLVKPISAVDLRMRLHVAERILGFTSHIQKLESFIPICSYCKDIRKDDGFWQQIEAYISQRTDSQFSHSICPDCYEKHVVPELKALNMTPPEFSSFLELGNTSRP